MDESTLKVFISYRTVSIRGGQGLPPELQAGALYDLPVIWYLTFYDIDIRKLRRESWQEWEVRISGEMGVSLTAVRIPHDALLEDHFQNYVVPRLIELPRCRQKPSVKPQYAWLFTAGRLAESMVATVTSPYRNARNAVTYVRTRLRAQLDGRGRR